MKKLNKKEIKSVGVCISLDEWEINDGSTFEEQIMGIYSYCKYNNYNITYVSYNICNSAEDAEKDILEMVKNRWISTLVAYDHLTLFNWCNDIKGLLDILKRNKIKLELISWCDTGYEDVNDLINEYIEYCKNSAN